MLFEFFGVKLSEFTYSPKFFGQKLKKLLGFGSQSERMNNCDNDQGPRLWAKNIFKLISFLKRVIELLNASDDAVHLDEMQKFKPKPNNEQ